MYDKLLDDIKMLVHRLATWSSKDKGDGGGENRPECLQGACVLHVVITILSCAVCHGTKH